MDYLIGSTDRKGGFFSESVKVFSEDINRAFLFFRNAELNAQIDEHFVNNIKIEKGKDTWTVGNKYTGYWVGISGLEAEVITYIDEPHYKVVEYKFEFQIGLKFIKSIVLYDITDLGGTLIMIKLQDISNRDRVVGEEDREFYKNLYDKFLLKAGEFLKTSGGKYYNYESGLIKQNQKVIWEYLTNMNKANYIEKVMADYFEYRGDILTKGSFIKGINNTENDQKKAFYLKVTEVQHDPQNNEWRYKLETFGVNCCFPKQEILLIVLFINENYSQVGYFHYFKENITRGALKKLSKVKKNFLLKAKTYFENL